PYPPSRSATHHTHEHFLHLKSNFTPVQVTENPSPITMKIEIAFRLMVLDLGNCGQHRLCFLARSRQVKQDRERQRRNRSYSTLTLPPLYKSRLVLPIVRSQPIRPAA